MILFLKSTTDDGDNKMPLHEKLVLIFKDRVKEADDDQDRARAERDLRSCRRGLSRIGTADTVRGAG
jgi:hypothetical protein